MFGFGKKKKEASQTSEKPASISVDAFVAEAQEKTSNLDGPTTKMMGHCGNY